MSSILIAGGSNGPLSGGGLLVPTAVKTSAYTANPGEFVPVDTTSGAVTVTLPAAPADGTMVGVKMVKQGSTNAVTVACGGADTFNTVGGSTSGTLSLLYQTAVLQYQAATAIWFGMDMLALSQLDLRYAQQVATGATAPAVSALTDGATIPTNAALGNVFTVTLGGNRTLSNPTNPVNGQLIEYQLTQDATGSRTVTWGSAFDFGTAGAPTLTTTAAKTDLIRFRYSSAATKWYSEGSNLGM